VTVAQTFENHFQERLEAVYVFPLPDDAAVHEMIMIMETAAFAPIYGSVRRPASSTSRRGMRDRLASLLEQERPNIFTMNVANIEPGHPSRCS